MREEKKALRQQQIEAAAYVVLEKNGYAGASMLAIAKEAKASNETLYSWYGDKKGLFQALVERNAEEIKTYLEAELISQRNAIAILEILGPKLLAVLTGDRAVAINRAAAADRTGELGETLSTSGREAIFPLLNHVLLRARDEGQLGFEHSEDAVGVYLDLLLGDQQIRRVIGRLPAPSQDTCEKRSQRAVRMLLQILHPSEPNAL